MRTWVKMAIFVCVALAIIVGSVYAAVVPGPHQVDGNLFVKKTVEGASDGLDLIPDTLGFAGWNQFNMHGWFDIIDLNGGTGVLKFNEDDNIFVDSGFEDTITFVDDWDGDETNDVLTIRGDIVNIRSNGGDVIIRLGS